MLDKEKLLKDLKHSKNTYGVYSGEYFDGLYDALNATIEAIEEGDYDK